MNERIEQLRKYNLWDGNTITTGYERPLYTEKIAQYMGNRIIKVLTGQRRVGKSFLLRQIASRLVYQGVNGSNILIINRELTIFDDLYTYKELDELIKAYLWQKHQLELRIAAEQAVKVHKQEEYRRIIAKEEERRLALQERTQRSSELYRALELQIRAYLTETKAYGNPSLKVADVAIAVGTSTTNVSEMCSRYLKISFFSLINSYRIEEFKRIVRDEQYANYTITALAEMCGFKKSSFFNVFKEYEGCTPAVWLKREGIKRT